MSVFSVEKKNKIIESKILNLSQFWKKLLSASQLPQLDKWIAAEFSKNKKYGSSDRKWYSDIIFGLIRNSLCCYFLSVFFEYYKKNDKNFSFLNEKDSSNFFDLFNEFHKKFMSEISSSKVFLEKLKLVNFENFFEFFLIKNKELFLDVFQNRNIQKVKIDFYARLLELEEFKNSLVYSSLPIWLYELIQDRFAQNSFDFKNFIAFQNYRPPVWIRFNHTSKVESCFNEFLNSGLDFKKNEDISVCALTGTKSIYNLESFKSGFFEIQDYASTRVCSSLNLKPGQYVWDACAGGGGKTLHIASILNNKGVIYGSDIREYKLDEIKRRAQKAQFFNIRTCVWDGAKLPDFPKEIQKKGGFDCVLVDAPCSASGTWRRNPDAKYKIDAQKVLEFSELQLKLLNACKSSVLVGGTLAYATCSFFTQENEHVINRFLSDNACYKLESMKLLGCPEADSDTLFVAVLKRITT